MQNRPAPLADLPSYSWLSVSRLTGEATGPLGERGLWIRGSGVLKFRLRPWPVVEFRVGQTEMVATGLIALGRSFLQRARESAGGRKRGTKWAIFFQSGLAGRVDEEVDRKPAISCHYNLLILNTLAVWPSLVLETEGWNGPCIMSRCAILACKGIAVRKYRHIAPP